MERQQWTWLWGAAALLLDRATKITLGSGSGGPLIPGILSIRPVNNTGMAFSLLSDHPWLLTGLTAAVLMALLACLFLAQDLPRLTRAGLWLVVGGGLGNLIDRLLYGHVVDFLKLEFVNFAIFNFADVCVVLGAALAAIGARKAM